jgi:hypothetical protein
MYSKESNLIIENNIQYTGAIAGIGLCKPAKGEIYGKEEIK